MVDPISLSAIIVSVITALGVIIEKFRTSSCVSSKEITSSGSVRETRRFSATDPGRKDA